MGFFIIMKIHKGWYFFIGIVLLLALLKWEFFPSPDKTIDNKPKTAFVKVSAMVVQPTEFSDEVSVSGTLMPAEMVTLQPEMAGKITGIFFQEGNPVSAGQLLVKLNDAEWQALRKKLKAQLAQANTDAERNRRLFEAKAISREVLEASQVNVEALQADLELNAAQIAKTEIRAPFSGKIGNRAVSVGATVNTTTPIATLYQNQSLKLKCFLPSAFRQGLKEGAELSVKLMSGKVVQARIYSIEPSADAVAGTFETRAVVKSTTEAQPGDIVSVSVRKNASEPAMRVPTGALMPVLKGNRVFIVNDGKAEPRDVVTGTRNDSSVLILSGLQAGDSLITGGLMFVKPGIPVKVTPNKTSRP